MSQETVAAAARMPLNHYRDFENGDAEPTEDEYKMLAKVFGLSPDAFKVNLKPMLKTIEMFEPNFDDNIFKTQKDREYTKLLVNMLSSDEVRLLTYYRTANSYFKNKMMAVAENSASFYDSVTEEYIESVIDRTIATAGEEVYKEKGSEISEKFRSVVTGEKGEEIKMQIKKIVEMEIDDILKNIK